MISVATFEGKVPPVYIGSSFHVFVVATRSIMRCRIVKSSTVIGKYRMKFQNLVYLRTFKPDFHQILIDLAIKYHK